MSGKYSAPAAACAAEILSVMKRTQGPVTLAQLERQLDRTKSLIFRVLRELEQAELLYRDSHGQYRVGIEAFGMATAYLNASGFEEGVRSVLLELADEAKETVNLGVLRGAEVTYLMKYLGPNSYVSISRVGGSVPANCVAMGKVLLAQLSDEEVAARFPEPLPRLTTHSLVTLRDLLDELAQVREQGYAWDRQEAALGRSGLALVVPFGDQRYPRAGVSISTSEEQFEDRRAQLLQLLRSAASRIREEFEGRKVLFGTVE